MSGVSWQLVVPLTDRHSFSEAVDDAAATGDDDVASVLAVKMAMKMVRPQIEGEFIEADAFMKNDLISIQVAGRDNLP